MGLLQKKPYVATVPLYRVGSTQTLLIVGLGNPGDKYISTRHNIGFAIVDNVANKLNFPNWTVKKDMDCEFTQQTIGDNRIILIKPLTYMNLSGQAARAVADFYKVPVGNITAVYDELDIPFGQIRTRTGGSSAGHNGVKSLIAHLGEEFGRVRIGTQNEHSQAAEGAKFVLDKFNKAEQAEMPNLIQEATSILSEYFHNGQLRSETRSFVL